MSAWRLRRPSIVLLTIALWLSACSSIAAAQELAGQASPVLFPAPASARAPAPERPAPLVPLYVGFAAMQMVDAHSTLRALDSGGREANPLVRPVAGSPAGLVVLKGATTAGVIVLTEKLWKRNRTAAVLTMIGLNSAYLVVATHNYNIGASHR